MSRLGGILRIKQITADMVCGMPRTLFVFDDTMQRIRPGSQAAALRAEPNVVGLPTRWHPGSEPSASFSDDNWQSNGIFQTISDAFDRIERAIIEDRNVVLPSNGFGVGPAELSYRAPMIHAFISDRLREARKLEADYSSHAQWQTVKRDRHAAQVFYGDHELSSDRPYNRRSPGSDVAAGCGDLGLSPVDFDEARHAGVRKDIDVAASSRSRDATTPRRHDATTPRRHDRVFSCHPDLCVSGD